MNITNQEQQLFDTLTAVANQHGTVLRVAGGWVRNKLMGLSSDDIDIAVDNMSGLAFANLLIAQSGGKVGVVKENPEASKHIETAIVDVCGFKVDFAGFRSEEYDEATRNPIVQQGDVLSDVYRRDFTINSLYYNLSTQGVEDITGQGIKDIQSKTVRLVIAPKEHWSALSITNEEQASKKSLSDDPLRILRAVRFAKRFGFSLDQSIVDAIKDASILDTFRRKISRERMEIELRKMMSEADPAGAIRTLSDFGLLYDVFKFPQGYCDWDLDQQTPHHELTVLNHTLEGLQNLNGILAKYLPDLSPDDKMVACYAILFHDLGKLNPKVHGYKVKDGVRRRTYYNHEEYSLEAAEYILRNLPGVRTKEIDRVKTLIDCARRVNPNYTPSNEQCGLGRKALGKFARLAGDDWLLAVLVGLADATAKKKDLIKTYPTTYYADMIEKLRVIGPEARAMKPLLDGNEIMEIVGKKNGPLIGKIIDRMIDWQLSNPKVSKKDAYGFVKSFKEKQ